MREPEPRPLKEHRGPKLRGGRVPTEYHEHAVEAREGAPGGAEVASKEGLVSRGHNWSLVLSVPVNKVNRPCDKGKFHANSLIGPQGST